MADWFKSRKTQTPSLLSIPSFDHTPAIPYDPAAAFENVEQQESRTRPASAMRVLSFMKSTPSTNSSSFPSPDFDWERLHSSAADAVWHEPNSDQIAESLKVIMMTRGNHESVPIQYNSNILHVLEVYWHQCEELKQKDLEIDELKAKLTDQMDQIELLGNEWVIKEGQYKTELKKLEVMVANGVGGIEAVMLGRSKSVLDRTSSPIEARIRRIREESGSSSTASQESRRFSKFTGSGSAKENNEIRLSKAFSQKRRPRPDHHLTEHFRPRNEHGEAKADHPERLARLRSPEPELQPQEDAESDMSSSSGDEEYTTTRSSMSDIKPLPKLLEEESSQLTRIEELPTKTHLSKTLEAQNRHFSYVPGDDSLHWRGQRPRVVSRKSPVKKETDQDGPDTYFSSEHPDDIGLSTFYIPHSTSSCSLTSPNQSQLLARHLSQWGPEKIKRGDSNSSQVTAIRDNSVRSSTELGSGSGDVTKQAATSNAAIAAARAMSEKKS